MSSGKKVLLKYSNPIDVVIISIAEWLSPYFKRINATPNQITTIGNIFRILAIYYLIVGSYRIAAVLYFIGYFFDCMDGYYARKYKMTSHYGDLYDHISDIVLNIVFLYILVRIDFQYKSLIFGIILIMLIMMLIQMGNEEILYNKKSVLTPLKKISNINYINQTRFFGCGTLFLVITLFVYNLRHFEN